MLHMCVYQIFSKHFFTFGHLFPFKILHLMLGADKHRVIVFSWNPIPNGGLHDMENSERNSKFHAFVGALSVLSENHYLTPIEPTMFAKKKIPTCNFLVCTCCICVSSVFSLPSSVSLTITNWVLLCLYVLVLCKLFLQFYSRFA